MSGVQVEQVNPGNEPLLRALWEACREAEAERPHGGFFPPFELFQQAFATSAPDRDVLLLAAFETVAQRGRVVGAARMELPTIDNRHLCNVQVYVPPPVRRRGIGSALLVEGERVAAAHGRTTSLGEAHGSDAGESAGVRFGAAHGYDVVHSEEVKLVDLLATEHTWPALEAHAAERLAPYQLVWWTDPAPEEYLPELCRMYDAFLDEAPTGGLDLRQQRFTPERLRDGERRRADTRRNQLVVAARVPDGTLAGHSAVTVSEQTAELAFISTTLVMPEHRGHRLGIAMKVRLHQLLRSEFPACATVVTGNAGVNTWMNAINDQLGYRVVEQILEMQKVLS